MKTGKKGVLHCRKPGQPFERGFDHRAGVGPSVAGLPHKFGHRGARCCIEQREGIPGPPRKCLFECLLPNDHESLQNARREEPDDFIFDRLLVVVGHGEPRTQATELERPLRRRLIKNRGNRPVCIGPAVEQRPRVRLACRQRPVRDERKSAAGHESGPDAEHGGPHGGVEIRAAGIGTAAGTNEGHFGAIEIRRRVGAHRRAERCDRRKAARRRPPVGWVGRGTEREGRERHHEKLSHRHDRDHARSPRPLPAQRPPGQLAERRDGRCPRCNERRPGRRHERDERRGSRQKEHRDGLLGPGAQAEPAEHERCCSRGDRNPSPGGARTTRGLGRATEEGKRPRAGSPRGCPGKCRNRHHEARHEGSEQRPGGTRHVAKRLLRPGGDGRRPRAGQGIEHHAGPERPDARPRHRSHDRRCEPDEGEQRCQPPRRPANRGQHADLSPPRGDEQPEQQPLEHQARDHDERREREKQRAERRRAPRCGTGLGRERHNLDADLRGLEPRGERTAERAKVGHAVTRHMPGCRGPEAAAGQRARGRQ